jgi:hypothetical protein
MVFVNGALVQQSTFDFEFYGSNKDLPLARGVKSEKSHGQRGQWP